MALLKLFGKLFGFLLPSRLPLVAQLRFERCIRVHSSVYFTVFQVVFFLFGRPTLFDQLSRSLLCRFILFDGGGGQVTLLLALLKPIVVVLQRLQPLLLLLYLRVESSQPFYVVEATGARLVHYEGRSLDLQLHLGLASAEDVRAPLWILDVPAGLPSLLVTAPLGLLLVPLIDKPLILSFQLGNLFLLVEDF